MANRILVESSKCFGVITGTQYDDGKINKMYNKGYLLQFAAHFLRDNDKTSPERLIEALNILKENKHVELMSNPDTYQVTYKCTELGESAANDGYYQSEAYKKISITAGSILAVGTPLIIWLWKLLPSLLRSLHG